MIDLKQVHAVLCQPEDVRNVGAAIRAVANHGLASLRIVKTPVGQSLDGQSQDGQDGQSPGQSDGQSDGQRQDGQSQDGRFLGAEAPDEGPFSREDLFHYSAGASERIPVQVFSSLDAALQDCAQVVGTSRRTRDPLAPPFWPAAGLRRRFVEEGPVAILFGTERTGLDRSEVDRCQALITVPTTSAHESLNLGHAVAIIGYELARPEPGPGPETRAAPEALRAPTPVREAFYAKVEAVSAETGYPPGRNPELFARKLRRILDRANPSADELAMLLGVFSEIQRLSKRG